MLLLSSADRDALFHFQELGDRSDREAEAAAAGKLAEALGGIAHPAASG